ncbi:MAG: IS5 family transposase [Methyloceanibacter sp.]|uniref:IS5 family transposase n=1 Tax=Methyloceanibacter sp. TaxID=1965321 RepID=UPI003EE41796
MWRLLKTSRYPWFGDSLVPLAREARKSDEPGFFDLDERYRALSKSGDPLERLTAVVDFEMFRPELNVALARPDGSKGGRPPMDAVMMFKVLVLQALYGLADERTEFQIRDRLSFMRFLGLDLHGRVPDARTIWLFCEQLTKAGAVERLFARFDAHLKEAGYLAMGGQMIDASIVEAPRQRNTDGEKADLKAGRIPEAWAAKPAKLRQKDRDGRWTLKRGRRKKRPDGSLAMEIAIPVYGYKSHIGADRRHRLIRTWTVTDAARHDGREMPALLDRSNTASPVWADTAYRSSKNEKRIEAAGLVSKVHFRRSPGKPLPPARQKANAARSRMRSAVEHVFADQKHRMGLFVRTIGLARARTKIGLANIAYNLRRYLYLETAAA